VSPDWPIETERLTLRPFVEDDFDALHAMQSDAEVHRYLYGEPKSPDESRDYLKRKIASSSWSAEGDWLGAAVIERATGTTVGDVSMQWVSEKDRTAEIGFIFHPRHQGQGFATEAARAMLDWAFGAAGLHRVVGRLEAHFVENEWVKGEWQSGLLYAILDREWTNRSGS